MSKTPHEQKHAAYAQENSLGRVVDRHDVAYVDWRDSLIPIAEASADDAHPALGDLFHLPKEQRLAAVHEYKSKWDAAFHRSMSELTGAGREAVN